jgi:carbon storage regulator
MLVLSRFANQTIEINGGLIKITVVAVIGGRVKIGIEAPTDIDVFRGELVQRDPPDNFDPSPRFLEGRFKNPAKILNAFPARVGGGDD